MTVSIWQADFPQSPVSPFPSDPVFDVAVVGGGIAGASIAYALSLRAPRLRVVLIEAEFAAYGATGRNAGFILAGTSDHYAESVKKYGRARSREVYAATLGTQRRLAEFLERFGNVCDYVPSGSLTLATSPDERALLDESATLLREDGFDVEFAPTDPLDRGFLGGIVNRHDGCLHSVKFARGLLSAATNLTPCEKTRCLGISSGDGRLAVETDRGTLRAERVVLALNAYAPLFDGFFTDKVLPRRGQCFSTAAFEKRLLGPVVYANDGFEYFRQLPDGRFLFGGGRGAFAETEIGYDDVTTDGVQRYLENFKDRYFPELRGIAVERRWSGVMGFAKDGLPLLGKMPGSDNVWFSVGFTGHGMGYSLEVGDLAAGMALSGVVPELFDAARLDRVEGD